jgi:hypothetical protein
VKAQERRHTCYTSVFGNYEPVWPPFQPDSGIRYVMVSDRATQVGTWLPEIVDATNFGSPRLANRFQKMRFQETLLDDNFSVYIDANIRPVASLVPLFREFEQSGADIGLYRHYSRHSVEAEARACIARNKVEHPETVGPELAFYATEGFADTGGLWEGSIIFKRHDSVKLQKAMKEWWNLYSRFQTRDQFSLPFIIWKHDLKVFDLGSDSSGLPKPFIHLQHSHGTLRHKLARYLQARAPEDVLWNFLHKIAGLLDRN